MRLSAHRQRRMLNELIDSDLGDDHLVPLPCQCDPPRAHGPHYVPLRRIRKGGDLEGRVALEDIELIQEVNELG